MVPSYSSAWPSAENFAAVASLPILVTKSPLSSETFSVLISSRVEKRSLVVLPPLVTQLAPACSASSSAEKAGAVVIGATASSLVVTVPPAPPQAATRRARPSRSNPPTPILSCFFLPLIRSSNVVLNDPLTSYGKYQN